MSKTLKFVVVLGLVGASFVFFGPVLLAILGEVLCGGVLVIAGITEVIGEFASIMIGFLFSGLLFAFLFFKSTKYFKRRVTDTTLINTPENTTLQNARYIKAARIEGQTDIEIREVFSKGGWNPVDADRFFAIANTIQ